MKVEHEHVGATGSNHLEHGSHDAIGTAPRREVGGVLTPKVGDIGVIRGVVPEVNTALSSRHDARARRIRLLEMRVSKLLEGLSLRQRDEREEAHEAKVRRTR